MIIFSCHQRYFKTWFFRCCVRPSNSAVQQLNHRSSHWAFTSVIFLWGPSQWHTHDSCSIHVWCLGTPRSRVGLCRTALGCGFFLQDASVRYWLSSKYTDSRQNCLLCSFLSICGSPGVRMCRTHSTKTRRPRQIGASCSPGFGPSVPSTSFQCFPVSLLDKNESKSWAWRLRQKQLEFNICFH